MAISNPELNNSETVCIFHPQPSKGFLSFSLWFSLRSGCSSPPCRKAH